MPPASRRQNAPAPTERGRTGVRRAATRRARTVGGQPGGGTSLRGACWARGRRASEPCSARRGEGGQRAAWRGPTACGEEAERAARGGPGARAPRRRRGSSTRRHTWARAEGRARRRSQEQCDEHRTRSHSSTAGKVSTLGASASRTSERHGSDATRRRCPGHQGGDKRGSWWQLRICKRRAARPRGHAEHLNRARRGRETSWDR